MRIECQLPKGILISCEFVEKVAAEVLKEMGISDYSLMIITVERNAIADLNQRFRGYLGSTDVLTFVYEEEPLEAEIFLCREEIEKSAEIEGKSLEEETLKLIIHGLLHIAGYNHNSASEVNENDRLMRYYLDKFKKINR